MYRQPSSSHLPIAYTPACLSKSLHHMPSPNPNTARIRWKICAFQPCAVDSTTSPLPKRSSLGTPVCFSRSTVVPSCGSSSDSTTCAQQHAKAWQIFQMCKTTGNIVPPSPSLVRCAALAFAMQCTRWISVVLEALQAGRWS